MSKELRSGANIGPQESRADGVALAAVTTQHNSICTSEPRGDVAAANDHSRAPRAGEGGTGFSTFITPHQRSDDASFGAVALSLDTMDEYAAELAEVGRMLGAGAFELRRCNTAEGEHDFKTTAGHSGSVLEVRAGFKGVRTLTGRG